MDLLNESDLEKIISFLTEIIGERIISRERFSEHLKTLEPDEFLRTVKELTVGNFSEKNIEKQLPLLDTSSPIVNEEEEINISFDEEPQTSSPPVEKRPREEEEPQKEQPKKKNKVKRKKWNRKLFPRVKKIVTAKFEEGKIWLLLYVTNQTRISVGWITFSELCLINNRPTRESFLEAWKSDRFIFEPVGEYKDLYERRYPDWMRC
jgi:hypothetical protein